MPGAGPGTPDPASVFPVKMPFSESGAGTGRWKGVTRVKVAAGMRGEPGKAVCLSVCPGSGPSGVSTARFCRHGHLPRPLVRGSGQAAGPTQQALGTRPAAGQREKRGRCARGLERLDTGWPGGTWNRGEGARRWSGAAERVRHIGGGDLPGAVGDGVRGQRRQASRSLASAGAESKWGPPESCH